MPADLVTLSACETGINERRPGDELIGLTRALIYAGTPSVVVSLWRVNTLSAQLFMKHFYSILKQGAMKVEALQQAQKALMRMTYADVYYFAESRRRAMEASWPNNTEALTQGLNLALLALEDTKPVDAANDTWRPFTGLVVRDAKRDVIGVVPRQALVRVAARIIERGGDTSRLEGASVVTGAVFYCPEDNEEKLVSYQDLRTKAESVMGP